MFINFKSRVARGALGLIFATALTYPTPANAVPGGVVGGVVGGVGGPVGGVAGGLGGA